MKKIAYLFILLTGMAILAIAVPRVPVDQKSWHRIDSLEAQGLYRSALRLVDQLYLEARQKSDPENELRALMYRLKYIQELEEDGQIAAITALQKELPDDRVVQGSVKHSMLAELYYRYYTANRWQINQNPIVDEGFEAPMINWSPERFYRVILEQYDFSLRQGDRLTTIRTGSLPGLWIGNLADTLNKPDLYSLLISRSIEFLQNAGEFPLPALKPELLCSPQLFMEPSVFIRLLPDSAATGWNPFIRSLKGYADWLAKCNLVAQVPVDIGRLRYVYQHSCDPRRDSLYESALMKWSAILGPDSANALVHEALATYYVERGARYQINHPDTVVYRSERQTARDWLVQSEKWSGTNAGLRCRNLLTSLMQPELSVLTEPYQLPGKAFPVSIEYRNLNQLHFRVCRMSALTYYTAWSDLEQSERLSRIGHLQVISDGMIRLPDNGDLNPHRINSIVDPLETGFYLLVFSIGKDIVSSDNLVVNVPVSVTRIAWLSRPGEAGSRQFYLRDRYTGEALKGLTVVPWYSVFDQETRKPVSIKGSPRTSGTEGFLRVRDGGPGRDDPSPKAYRLQIYGKTDSLVTQELFYPGYSSGKPMSRTGLVLYTDRSLYKPGEQAHFRGVLIDYHGDSLAIHRADSVELTLQDPRYQIVEQFVLPVDSLGIFTGSVHLPAKGLTGSYRIQSKYGQTVIRMEQYRRPAFTISLDRGTRFFSPGDTMLITGTVKALSGEPVTNASVFAEVNLEQVMGPRRWSPNSGQKVPVATIRTATDRFGMFTCSWQSVPIGSLPFQAGNPIRYTVGIRVTDLNGESQQEETQLDSGTETANLSISLPDRIVTTDSLKCSIQAVNSDGRIVSIPLLLKISKLVDPRRIWTEPELPQPDRFAVTRAEWCKRVPDLPYNLEHKPSSWPISMVIVEIPLKNDSITQVSYSPRSKWREGWYKMELLPEIKGICAAETRYFRIDDPEPERLGEDIAFFAQLSSSVLEPGNMAGVNMAAGKKGFVLIELQKRKGEPVDEWLSLDRKVRQRGWKVTEDWRGGAVVSVSMIRGNRLYQKTHKLTIPFNHSVLTITNPERIGPVEPGDSLSIRFQVIDGSGTPASASLGVTVYDASLDQIAQHNWNVVSRPVFHGGPIMEGMSAGLNGSYPLKEPRISYIEVPYVEPVQLNWFGLGYYGISQNDATVYLRSMAAQPESASGVPAGKEQRKSADNQSDKEEMVMVEEQDATSSPSVVIRNDFRETAYFAGNILTDKDGFATLSFKIPDAFTEWKVMVTGMDGQLASGAFEQKFRSAKELMLKSNFPEFMRTGDSIELACRLGWYGKGPIETSTNLMINDSTGISVSQYPEIVSLLQTGGVEPSFWPFKARKPGTLNYRIFSASESGSDALSDTLVVYPDNVRLWEAQPFFMAIPGRKKLSVSQKPIEAVFEVTTTPAWQVLQSIPLVINKERDCSEYWFSRFYLGCLVGDIADKYPSVADRFLSDSITPDRQDRLNQIREWMDPYLRLRERAYVLEKLLVLQNPDGTWPWFKGMGTDLFMTQQIIAGFGDLKSWGIFDLTGTQQGNYVITKAIEAMDRWMYNRFREEIRQDSIQPRPIQLSPLIIHYLYARSYFSAYSLAPAHEIAWLHYNERIPIEWTRHEPGLQALMAISSLRLGRLNVADPIYRSLRERARIDEQWGIYWPRKGYGSGWFDWDLLMQSRMIELYAAIEEGHADLEQMKVYLIHQKRGRDWGNGLIAAWASRSLLFYGNDLSVKPASVGMTWGDEQYSPLRIKTGGIGVTGYYRFEWKTASEIPDSETMEITKTEGGPAWGTLFTLQEHRLDDLAAAGGPLKIARKVMVQDLQGRWNPINPEQAIRIGNRIRVQLTIQSDRELSYLEIKDYLGTGIIPVQVLSGFQYSHGLSAYQSREPEALVYHVPQLSKGYSTIEYQAVVEQSGDYFGGYSTITSLYAPEFRAWSSSVRIRAKR